MRVRMPIGAASSVVRHYATTLTDEPSGSDTSCAARWSADPGRSTAATSAARCPRTSRAGQLPGWSWADVLPHFRAIENDLDFDGPLHGSDGPILVRRVSEFDGCTASFVNARDRNGIPRGSPDLNGASAGEPLPPGVGAVPLNINGGTGSGRGVPSCSPHSSGPNLTLLADTRVGRIRFDEGRAVGVDCVGPDGPANLTADRIVLSAGAIGSAHLLMLSGIGPEDTLAAAGIPVVVTLPVGMRIE